MDIKLADIIFTFDPWNPVSELIAWNTFPIMFNGEYHHVSHSEIVTDIAQDGGVQVMSAEAEGLSPKWIHFEDIPFWVLKTCPYLTELQRTEMVRWARAHEGVGYDFLGLMSFPLHMNLQNLHKTWCSKAVFDNYLLQVDDLFKDPKTNGIMLLRDVAWISPAHLYTSPYLPVVEGSK